MNYDLARQRFGKNENNVRLAFETGDMPSSMLMAKFEETDIGGDEDLYNDYSRRVLTDQRPDTNLLAHEEARGGVNSSKGLLQHHYYGHRGEADWEKPEIFLGFGGPEDHDNRGTSTDPDFKQLVRQEDARMRFVRWAPDADNSITGGGRSESMVMNDQQKLFRFTRERLKVFDRQIDGRREGMRRNFEHKSDVAKQEYVQSYGDYIKDYALNPQRRANMIAREVIRNSPGWRDETVDQDFEIMRYSQAYRRAQTKDAMDRVLHAQKGHDSRLFESDLTKCYKAVGLLMKDLINNKRNMVDSQQGDIDYAASAATQSRKTAAMNKDLMLILQSMVQDGNFSQSDLSMIMKTAAPQERQHLARTQETNHLQPAHHYLNAELLYKSVKPGADLSVIRQQVVTDANAPVPFTEAGASKSAKRRLVYGMGLDTDNDRDETESTNTVNYKTLARDIESKVVNADGEDYKKESDATQSRATNHQNYRTTDMYDTEATTQFNDNASKEHYVSKLGKKYNVRDIDRDSTTNGIAASS